MQPTKLQLTGQHQLRRVEFISPTKLVTDISASYYKLIKSVEILKTLFRGAKTEQRCFNINISLKIFPTQFYLGTFWIRAPFSHFMNIFREVSYSLLPCWYVEYKIRKLNYDKFDIIVRVHQLSPVFFHVSFNSLVRTQMWLVLSLLRWLNTATNILLYMWTLHLPVGIEIEFSIRDFRKQTCLQRNTPEQTRD